MRPLVARMLTKQVAAKVRRDHYPAPYAMIDLWKCYAGSDAMYVQEAHSIARLMVNDTARNLVRVFLLQDRLKSLGKKSDLVLKQVHVVGAGTMGGDIAAWCALRGFKVTLQDREEKYVQPAMARAQKLFAEAAQRGRSPKRRQPTEYGCSRRWRQGCGCGHRSDLRERRGQTGLVQSTGCEDEA